MTRFRLLLVLGSIVSGVASLQAADPGELESLLKREITGTVLPAVETQRYCEDRIPRMPKIETAAEWEAEAARLRAAVLEKIVYRGEATRWRDAKSKVQWLDTIDGGPGYRIKKLRYEVLPGLWTAALLYEPEKLSGKVPAILNVNGHSPEGKAYRPKQIRCINQAKRGMLALNLEWIGMGQLRTAGFNHFRMNQIDLCGTSGLAPFYLCLKRGLDILLSLEHTDPERVAVTGLSGGGWQTIMISSLDTRVKLCNPVAGHSSLLTRTRHHKDMGDSEQIPNDLATVADYAHLTAMMAPRPTLLTYNVKDDCCFESGYALPPMLRAAGPMFRLFDAADALRSHVNHDPGTHNYELDNRQALYRMLGAFFFPGSKEYDPKEIPSAEEVKTGKQLFVELPEKNEDFHTLALALSKPLPREAELPKEKGAALAWQQDRRARLREIVRAKDYEITAVKVDDTEKSPLAATFWRLKMDGPWTVPAVEIVRGDPKQTAILLADAGRGSTAGEVARLLKSGHRVIAVDLLNFGECAGARAYDMMIACVGDRLLGLQGSQLAAIARWAASQHKTGPVRVVAQGLRCSNAALVAAALEEQAIGQLELHGSLGSLKEVIRQSWTLRQSPEVFCFGLLETFDIKHLAALVAPRPSKFVNASDRAKTELADLAAWYRVLGSEFDPLSNSTLTAVSDH